MSTAHDRAQKRYRARQKNDTIASAMGWEQTDIVSVYIRQDGVNIALDNNSQRVPLVGEQFVKVDAPEREDLSPKSKVYAPKSWDPDKWNTVVRSIAEQSMPVDVAVKLLTENTTLDAKQKRQALAVIEAMPTKPDWYADLPHAPVV